MKYLVIVSLLVGLVSPVLAHHEKDPLVRGIKTTSTTKDGK
jgi:hypothetical protein